MMTLAQLKATFGITSPGVDTGQSNSEPQNFVGDVVYYKGDYNASPPANGGKATQIEYTLVSHNLVDIIVSGTPGFADSTLAAISVCTSLLTSPYFCTIKRVSDGQLLTGIHESQLMPPGTGAGSSTAQIGFTTFMKNVVGAWTP